MTREHTKDSLIRPLKGYIVDESKAQNTIDYEYYCYDKSLFCLDHGMKNRAIIWCIVGMAARMKRIEFKHCI